MTSADHPDALPGGHRVQEYEFLSVLGVGGFGITYLAKDTLLNRKVAIKEYLPRDFAIRTADHSVRPRSSPESENYTWGLERFLDEARTLAQLNHPGIIRVYKYFEAHGSGYIVMEYVEGETLSERLRHENTLDESQLMAILNPLIEGLEQVHAAGYLHRDITPKNILLRKDGSPVLIDFGSARQVLGVRSRSVTAVATAGYAPLEQYSTRGRQQGPWTDIYGLSAVAYRCITGIAPKDATERAQGEVLTPASKLAKDQYAKDLLTAIDRGLSIKVEDRPKNLKTWCSLWMQKEEQQTTATEAKKQEIGQDEAEDAENQQTRAGPNFQFSSDTQVKDQEDQQTRTDSAGRHYDDPNFRAKVDVVAQFIEKTGTGYAGFWRRLMAYFFDYILLILVLTPVAFVTINLSVLLSLEVDPRTPMAPLVIGNLLAAWIFLAAWIYSAAFESSKRQATPGKMLLGIKVTDLEGNRVTFLRATGRYFGKYISSILLIGFLMIAFSKKKQGLHDHMAGCLVIKK